MALTVTPAELTATALTLTTAAQPNITSVGTLTTLTVDDITINSSTISDAADLGIASGGTLTVDVAGQIILDADSGGDILLKDGGTDYGKFSINSGDWVLTQPTANKDILFKGNDGNALTALKLDMSASGAATFNAAVTIGGNLSIAPASNTPYISGGTVSTVFRNNANSASLITILDGGNVGIGASSPAGKLHVYSGDAGAVTPSSQADDLVVEASTEGGITIMTPDSESARIRFTSPSTESGDVGGADIFYRQNINKMSLGTTVSGGKLAFDSGADVETMVLDGGNVGIGHDNPADRLVVQKDTANIEPILVIKNDNTTADNGTSIDFSGKDNSANNVLFGRIATKYTNHSTEKSHMIFSHRNDSGSFAEWMRVTHDGNVGIGTDSPYSNAKLTVNGGIRFKTTPWSDGTALNVVSSNTYTNFNVANTITSVNYKCFILTIYSTAGYSQCFFIANAGAGTGFPFTALRPDSATPVSGNLGSGFTVDVTGNGNEDFLIAVTYGGGALSVKRTAADNQSSSWGVFVHVLSG